MNTAKPISTISFNSEGFLKAKLEELLKARKVDFYVYIKHKGEDDEVKKDHIHVYLEPSKRTQTAALKDEFKEYDPTHPDKPLGCLTFRPSQFGDWYLYDLHDPTYLASKMQARRYHYAPEDMRPSDQDELDLRIYDIDMSDATPIKRLSTFKQSGKSFADAVNQGLIPIAQIKQYSEVWELLVVNKTNRGGRATHSPVEPAEPVCGHDYIIDNSTGEYIDDLPEWEAP